MPREYVVGNELVEMLSIGKVPARLHRSPATIRAWVSGGVIPRSGYITSSPTLQGRRHLWSAAQVEILMRVAEAEGVLMLVLVPGPRVRVRVQDTSSRREPLRSSGSSGNPLAG